MIPGPRIVPEYSPLLLSELGRKLVIDATWTSTLSQKDFHHSRLKDSSVNSRVPTRFEPPHVRPLGDLRFVVGRKVPSIFIYVAFPEMRGLVIIRSVIVVEQFESCKTTLCIRNQRLSTSNRGRLRTWKLIHLICRVNQPSSKGLGDVH